MPVSWTVISIFGLAAVFEAAARDGHLASVGRVFDGVADHMIKDFIEQVFISADLGQVADPAVENDVAFLEGRLKYLLNFLDDRRRPASFPA